MTKENIKIILCPVEIANQLHVISNEINKYKVQCDTLIFDKNIYYPDNQYSYILNLKKYSTILRPVVKIYNLFKVTNKYDVFHFFSKSFTYSHIDLIWLKFKGKKVIYHFHGSDIRPPKYISNVNKIPVRDRLIYIYNSIFNKIVFAFTDQIIVSTPDLLQYAPNAIYIPNSIYPLKIIENKKNKIPLITHAPTNNNKKGTAIIEKTINKLKNKYQFHYQRISSKTNQSVISQIEKSDFIIDQLLVGWYGVFAIEAMMLGKPVIVYIRKDIKKTIPIINADTKTIYAQLSKLLSGKNNIDREKIKKYALRTHHPKVNAKKLMEIYK